LGGLEFSVLHFARLPPFHRLWAGIEKGKVKEGMVHLCVAKIGGGGHHASIQQAWQIFFRRCALKQRPFGPKNQSERDIQNNLHWPSSISQCAVTALISRNILNLNSDEKIN
jgi:hypothetical protein